MQKNQGVKENLCTGCPTILGPICFDSIWVERGEGKFLLCLKQLVWP